MLESWPSLLYWPSWLPPTSSGGGAGMLSVVNATFNLRVAFLYIFFPKQWPTQMEILLCFPTLEVLLLMSPRPMPDLRARGIFLSRAKVSFLFSIGFFWNYKQKTLQVIASSLLKNPNCTCNNVFTTRTRNNRIAFGR